MTTNRRDRLEQVLLSLIQLDQFTAEEAKQHCNNSAPAYVTRTLTELIQDGHLQVVVRNHRQQYSWKSSNSGFRPQVWIDQRIHASQVKQIPAKDRPRERLLRHGPGSLSDAELLAILIRVGVPKESAVTGGQRIANRFSSRWTELIKCSPTDLKGVSPAATASSYCQIMAGIELGKRVFRQEEALREEPTKITSTDEAIEFCDLKFARLAHDRAQEEFHIVTLDTKHKPIHDHQITVGTLDASLVHPREVFRPAIRDAAAAMLLVHNHPSGDPTPSREDIQVTKQLTESGELLGITVLDHIIVAANGSVSLRAMGN